MEESLEKLLSYLENDDMASLMEEISMQSEENTGFDNVKQQRVSSEKLLFSFEDSNIIAVPNTSNSTQEEEPDNGKPKRGRSLSQTQDHILAERKRRENLTCMFTQLAAMIPGLKKMDKVTILSNAIDYVKYLQKRVKDLEEQNKKRKIESSVCIKMNNVDVSWTSHHGLDRPIRICPKVEARVSGKDVLIRVTCDKQKDIASKLLAKLEAHNLSIVCTNVLPLGNSALNFISIAQVDQELSTTMDDLVKLLAEDLLKICNLEL